jgi:hypothetical protein
MILKPKSKGECSRLVIQTCPPLDHKYGWYGTTVERWAKLFGINKKKFWKVFGVNTCVMDEETGQIVYYSCDIDRTIRECINRKWVHSGEWD